jgi:hypothetical protein
MHFQVKNTLKNNRNHTPKRTSNLKEEKTKNKTILSRFMESR